MIFRDDFSTGVYFENIEFTPSEVKIYIDNTSGENFADEDKTKLLIETSKEKFEMIIKKYDLDMDQTLRSGSSQSGKDLAGLVFEHSNETIRLIVEGGHARGVFI